MFQAIRARTGIGAQTVIGADGGLSAFLAIARAPHSLGKVGLST